MTFEMRKHLPKKVDMLELLARDGLQHANHIIPSETKVWFIEQFIKAGYKNVEVTNFTHPKTVPQHVDAEDILQKVWQIDQVKKGEVKLVCYGMTRKAFERAAQAKQEGYGPHSVAFTISTEDIHCKRNAGRTREEYFDDIPEFVKTAKANGFEIIMALACVYGSPCAGPVPIENTIELMERGLDLGIRRFTPCDTTGEANPLRAYEYMSTLVDKFGKHDGVKFRVAHFHDARGQGLANYLACIMAGATTIETSLGQGGGQPAFLVGGIPGLGSGPIYTNSDIVGNGATEDILVMLDEMGIDVGVDIDRMLQLGRVLEWVYQEPLRPYTTKSGRPIKYPTEWNLSTTNLDYLPPYKEGYWAAPGKYKPASAEALEKEFKGRKFRWDPFEQVKGTK
ncbi:MAG: hypothetical protein HYX90_11650 [Chloroflexi bacterium]|nr:hypothetical protein [Chloroflexota bacterium]